MIERAGTAMRDQNKIKRVTEGVGIVEECRSKGKKSSFFAELLQSIPVFIITFAFLATQCGYIILILQIMYLWIITHQICLRARSKI